MFVVEITSEVKAGLVLLLADLLDFLGDTANYGISLWVLSMGLDTRRQSIVAEGDIDGSLRRVGAG